MNTITTLLVASAVACLLATPASARPVDDIRSTAPVAEWGSPYAIPLAALDGDTLAQYLADHQAGGTACCAR